VGTVIITKTPGFFAIQKGQMDGPVLLLLTKKEKDANMKGGRKYLKKK
jgi:hypothetical protein